MTLRADVAVVGGGLVGLASARALQETGRQVVVLEAEAGLARHQSGRNSGVIHSGLYYAPGSLKARTCAEGRDALYAFCRDEGIPHGRTGKLVVAAEEREGPALERLWRRGEANGLEGLALLDRGEMREVEPAVAGVRGLLVREAGVCDFPAVARALARRFEEAGGRILLGRRVRGIFPRAGSVEVDAGSERVEAGFLVTCGGLHAHRLARLEGLDPGVRIAPFRGEYYRVTGESADRVRSLVYPVPDPALPFLGVHLHRRVDGEVEAGPNAIPALHPEGYRRRDLSLGHLAEMAAFPGLWRMGLREWRRGARELARTGSRRRFLRELRRLVPGVRARDLVRGPSGVRAQAVDRGGRLVDDFLYHRGPRSLHVLNAPSPAATACLAIGRLIAREAAGGPAEHPTGG